MNTVVSSPADRRPADPLLRAADAALRRAAIKAQERARAVNNAKAEHSSSDAEASRDR